MDRKLTAFLSISRLGNFSRAAENLHMSQPAISQQIQSLEQELGVKLFERNTKRVALTRAGKIVEHYGSEVETVFDTMKRRLEDLTNVIAGPLAIAASYTFGEYVLPYAVASFCRKHPNVRPSIQILNTIQVAQMVQEDAIDVGIVEGEIQMHGVRTEEMMKDKMLIIASPSHAVMSEERPGLDSPDITWILREEGSGTRAAANRTLEALGITPKGTMEFGSTQAIKASVQAGLGLAVMSELAVQDELEKRSLVVVPTQDTESAVRTFYLLHRESAFMSGVADGFREFLCEYVRVQQLGQPG